MLGLTINLSAQTGTERLKNDAKKFEKRLKEEGWREVSGQPPMPQQIYSAYKLKNEMGADLQPKYVFGQAKEVGQSQISIKCHREKQAYCHPKIEPHNACFSVPT